MDQGRMDEGQMIQLAERLARDLEGVPRNEWCKWADLAEKYGLETGRKLALKISSDVGVRVNIQAANGRIADAIGKNKASLEVISRRESSIIFGYVSWMLKAAEKDRQGKSERHSGSKKHSFGRR